MTGSLNKAGLEAFVIFYCLVFLCSATNAENKSVIRVKGSNDMATYVDTLAKKYMEERPNVFVVVSGGGLKSGFDGLLNKEVDVVMSLSPLNDSQKRSAKNQGVRVQESFFGWRGIAVFVHPKSNVASLTLDQIRNIFTGKSISWMDVLGSDKPINVYIGEYPFSEAYNYFRDFVLKGKPFKKEAIKLRYYKSIIQKVALDRYGIGLAPMVQVERVGREYTVKMIGVKNSANSPPIFPINASVDDRSYPLIRPLYLFHDMGSKNTFVGDFANYCSVHGLAGKAKLPER